MLTKRLYLFSNVVLCLLLSIIQANATTHKLIDCEYATVDNFINHATPAGFTSNDTVVCPSGSWTWGASLPITVGVTLIGGGISVTTITSSGGASIVSYNPANPSLNETFRIAGFTLNGNARNVLGVSITNSSTTSIITNIRIDHNEIYGFAGRAICVRGLVYGLIDNNTLMANSGTNNSGIFYLSGKDAYSWDVPLEVGSINSLYIEDNVISGTNNWWVSQTNEGTRWVFRNNTVNLANSDGQLDWHGNQPTDTSNPPTSCLPTNPNNARGAVGVEVYDNTFTNMPNNNTAISARGGTGIIYNNTITGFQAACSQPLVKFWEEDASPTSFGACSPLKEDYPGYDPIIGYFWNNQHKNGANDWTSACLAYNLASDPTMIPEQTSYWADTQNEQTSATTYWTSGVAASRNPTTCTAQDVYWETDTRKLYRCTATNTWTFIYTPYTYPHPLKKPYPPNNLRIVSPQ